MITHIDQITDAYPDETFILADGFNKALIGIDENSMRVIYSTSKCIEILSKTMSRSEAIEFFNFNIGSAYVGEKTPIFCNDLIFEL
jgi:hypothetical protein